MLLVEHCTQMGVIWVRLAHPYVVDANLYILVVAPIGPLGPGVGHWLHPSPEPRGRACGIGHERKMIGPTYSRHCLGLCEVHLPS